MQIYLGQVGLQPLSTHLPVTTANFVQGSPITVDFTAVSPYVAAQSVEIWNRGSSDCWVNYNGIAASGGGSDLHLRPGEYYGIAAQISALSVLSTSIGTIVEVQGWA